MYILAIETTGAFASVALAEFDREGGYRPCGEIMGHDRFSHLRNLAPQIKQVAEDRGLTIGDIDVIAVSRGPGSFTGIRIGVATIKALSLATGKPSVAIDALEAIAYGEGECIAAIDARNGNCYAARFDKDGNMLEEKLMPRAQADAAGVFVIDARPDDIGKRLTAIAVEKVESKRFDAALEPKYLRKSQAERMKDGD